MFHVSVPGNMLPSEFNRYYVEPILNDSKTFSDRIAPSDGERFFKYILCSKLDVAQNKVEKHQKIILAYLNLPILNIEKLFPSILCHLSLLDQSTILAVFQNIHVSHTIFLHKQLTEGKLLDHFIGRNNYIEVLLYLMNLLSTDDLYRALSTQPFYRALMGSGSKGTNGYEAQKALIDQLNQRGMIDLISPSQYLALEEAIDGGSLLTSDIQCATKRYFDYLLNPSKMIMHGNISIPQSSQLNQFLINKLLEHDYLGLDEHYGKHIIKHLYFQLLHSEKKFLLTLVNDKLNNSFCNESISTIIDNDPFDSLSQSEASELLTTFHVGFSVGYNPKIINAFKRIYLASISDQPGHLISGLCRLQAFDYIEFILEKNIKNISFANVNTGFPLLFDLIQGYKNNVAGLQKVMLMLIKAGYTDQAYLGAYLGRTVDSAHFQLLRTTEQINFIPDCVTQQVSKQIFNWFAQSITYQGIEDSLHIQLRRSPVLMGKIFSFLPLCDAIRFFQVMNIVRRPINKQLEDFGLIINPHQEPFRMSADGGGEDDPYYSLIRLNKTDSNQNKERVAYANWLATLWALTNYFYCAKQNNNADVPYFLYQLMIFKVLLEHPTFGHPIDSAERNLEPQAISMLKDKGLFSSEAHNALLFFTYSAKPQKMLSHPEIQLIHLIKTECATYTPVFGKKRHEVYAYRYNVNEQYKIEMQDQVASSFCQDMLSVEESKLFLNKKTHPCLLTAYYKLITKPGSLILNVRPEDATWLRDRSDIMREFLVELKKYIINYNWDYNLPGCFYCFFGTNRRYSDGMVTLFVPSEVKKQLDAIDDCQETSDVNQLQRSFITVMHLAYLGFRDRLTIKNITKICVQQYRTDFDFEYKMKRNCENDYFSRLISGVLIRELWYRHRWPNDPLPTERHNQLSGA